MRDALGAKEGFDLKHSLAGMVDIEFIAQFGVLAWANAHPELTQWSDNVRIFAGFATAGLMREDDASRLADAYLHLRAENHRLSLLGRKAVVEEDWFVETRDAVASIWQRYLA